MPAGPQFGLVFESFSLAHSHWIHLVLSPLLSRRACLEPQLSDSGKCSTIYLKFPRGFPKCSLQLLCGCSVKSDHSAHALSTINLTWSSRTLESASCPGQTVRRMTLMHQARRRFWQTKPAGRHTTPPHPSASSPSTASIASDPFSFSRKKWPLVPSWAF